MNLNFFRKNNYLRLFSARPAALLSARSATAEAASLLLRRLFRPLIVGVILIISIISVGQRARAQAIAPACIATSDAAPDAVIDACNSRLSIKDLPEADAADVYIARAAMYDRQGHQRLAIDDLSQAIRRRATDATVFFKRAALYRSIKDDDRAISDLSEAIRLEPMRAQHVFERAELFRKKGDRRRAFIDYGAVLKLDPSFEVAAVHRKTLALEIEKIGALMPVAARPSFDCSSAKRAVERAICADIELSQLDRDLDTEFQSVLAKAPPIQAETLRSGQESFVATRNMSFGQAGYDLKKAMTRRLMTLRSKRN